jgi:glucose-fructose oxidoreductase
MSPHVHRSKRSSAGDEGPLIVAAVTLTHPRRVLFPSQGITKLELARYYESIADWVLPHVAGRPLTLVRCPRGQTEECFIQKHVTPGMPPSIRRLLIEERDGTAEGIGIDDWATGRDPWAGSWNPSKLSPHPSGVRCSRFEQSRQPSGSRHEVCRKAAVAMAAKKQARRSTQRVRYAVVGLGHIAQVAVLPAFEHAKKNSTLAALVSDDPAKLTKLGRKYGVKNLWTYAQYNECLSSGEIDAVYIALPNDMHLEYTVRAARAGVHVLCEKPLALSERDCEDMIAICGQHEVQLMTAYRLHFERANLKAIEIAASGKIGEPRLFDSVFTMQVKDKENIRLSHAKGGGPMWDIGVYCTNAARYLFQSEPEEVLAASASSGDPRFNEVDEAAAAILRFPGGRLASFACSFGAADFSSYRIVGTKGDLRVEPAYEYAGELKHVLTIGNRHREQTFPKRDQFGPELVYFSNCVIQGIAPEPSGREGLADVRVIEAILKSARKRAAIRLEPFEKQRRPTLAQEMHMPPVSKPEHVRARAPSRS